MGERLLQNKGFPFVDENILLYFGAGRTDLKILKTEFTF